MSLLNLDNTLNKYLEIINKQILEPHIISKGGISDADYNYIATGTTINNETLSIKYNAVTEETEKEAILKIKQTGVNDSYFADFTNSSSVIIDSANIASNLHTDDDGLIYYLHNDNDKRHYDLSDITSIPSNITDYSYFDYLVRFKILRYIKDNNHTNIQLVLRGFNYQATRESVDNV